MISAKDEFFLEREHINELARLIERSDLKQDDIEDLSFELNEQEFEELKKMLSDREISSLERIRRGESVNQWQINEAVKKAANG